MSSSSLVYEIENFSVATRFLKLLYWLLLIYSQLWLLPTFLSTWMISFLHVITLILPSFLQPRWTIFCRKDLGIWVFFLELKYSITVVPYYCLNLYTLEISSTIAPLKMLNHYELQFTPLPHSHVIDRLLQMLLYIIMLLAHCNTPPLLIWIYYILLIKFSSLCIILGYLTGLQLNIFYATLRAFFILVSNFFHHQIDLFELILMQDGLLMFLIIAITMVMPFFKKVILWAGLLISKLL